MSTTTQLTLGRFHRYPARYAASVIGMLLDETEKALGRQPRNVLDPFCGTGATMAAARQLGIDSMGVELTHLGRLISKVRLNPPKDLDRAVERGVDLLQQPTRVRAISVEASLRAWLGDANSLQLTQYLRRLASIEDPQERDWLTLAISDALRPASVWLPGSIKPQRDPDRDPPALKETATYALRRLYRDTTRELSNGVNAFVVGGDARELPIEDNVYEAVVTSPPYFSMYDYFDVQRLSYLAFRWPALTTAQIGRSSRVSADGVGFVPPRAMRRWYASFNKEQTIQGRALRAYWNDMHIHLQESLRVLAPGGVAVYAMANTRRQHKLFNLVDSTAELMERVGFEDVRTQERRLDSARILPAGRDPETGRFSSESAAPLTEWIIVARKEGGE